MRSFPALRVLFEVGHVDERDKAIALAYRPAHHTMAANVQRSAGKTPNGECHDSQGNESHESENFATTAVMTKRQWRAFVTILSLQWST